MAPALSWHVCISANQPLLCSAPFGHWRTTTFHAALRCDRIEQVFAKLKTLLRKAAERSVEAVWKRVGTLLDRFHHTSANVRHGH